MSSTQIDQTFRRRLRLAAGHLLLASLLAWGATAPVAAQSSVIVAFGDSITHGFGDGSVTCQGSPGGNPGGYPPRLRTRLENEGFDVVTRTSGLCGEMTSGGVTRIDNVIQQNPNADIFLIMEGTNDLSNTSISTQSMRFNLNTMVDKVIEAGMVPVLATPIPRAPEEGFTDRTGFLASLLREDAAERDLVLADAFQVLNSVPGLFDRFYFDPLHPTGDGYSILAGAFQEPTVTALGRRAPVPCVPGDETLCLSSERFKVEVEWVTEEDSGQGQAVPLSADTGFFWFFNEENLEMVVKVLDGRDINGHFWVFYGGLSDVEYTLTVTDSETGRRKTYENPQGTQASVGDTLAFDAEEGFVPSAVPAASLTSSAAARAPRKARSTTSKDACSADERTLCLQEGRFAVSVTWTDFEDGTGHGTAVSLTEETGYFWFFNSANVELVLKILDGRDINDHFWVFYGALSNVGYEIEITDTESGETVRYSNPRDNFGSDSDVEAFFVPLP